MPKVFKSRIFILIIALLVCAVSLLAYTKSVNKKSQIIKAVVLKENISAGTEITEEMLEVKEIGGYGIAGILTAKNDVIGKYAVVDMQKNDILTANKLTSTSVENNNILDNLDGTRIAFSVTTKESANSVSDKLRGGDIVSVYLYKDGAAEQPPTLTYVKVISVVTKNGEEKNNDTVTDNIATVMLLVTPSQAKELTEYEDNAEIHFALVYRGDEENARKFLEKQSEVSKNE